MRQVGRLERLESEMLNIMDPSSYFTIISFWIGTTRLELILLPLEAQIPRLKFGTPQMLV